MREGNRSDWIATTHDWAEDVDAEHLAGIRRSRTDYEGGGRRHQILEVLAYADDEAEALGRTGNVVVRVAGDGMVSVSDDGRGTDTRRDASGNVVRKPVMATEDLRFFAVAQPPLLPDGLPRRGISTVAALSSTLSHENHRTDGSWAQDYRNGIPAATLRKIPPTAQTGTTVRFRSDLGAPWSLTEADLHAFLWLQIRCSEDSVTPARPIEGA